MFGNAIISKLWLHEGKKQGGLGLVNTEVKKINTDIKKYRLPHIGWNNVSHDGKGIFHDIPNNSDFYFVHSFCMQEDNESKFFYTDYGVPVIASVQKGNIYGVQFHPKKSQKTA